MATADFVTVHLPKTPETLGLIGRDLLSRAKPGLRIVNTARGEVIDEAMLTKLVESGDIAGAGLDVYEHEPLPVASPLWDLPNVIAMPHSAGHSDGNAARVAAMFLDNLGRWCAGQALHNQVR